jgi:galactokinase
MTPPPSTTDLARDPEALVERLRAAYPDEAEAHDPRVVHAPGRVNLIGEHTDYNEGFVLPVAIDLGISLALFPTEDRRVEVMLAETGERDGFELGSIGPKRSTWIDYVAGMAWSLLDAGAPVTGVRAVLASNLPQGSGLSSSAALELVSSLALSGGRVPDIDRMTLARLAQRAENVYVGVNSGLMDQFA